VHSTLVDLARAKRLPPSYVSGILRLTLLAPEIVEAILDGRQPAELQLEDLLEGFPLEWERQISLLRSPHLYGNDAAKSWLNEDSRSCGSVIGFPKRGRHERFIHRRL